MNKATAIDSGTKTTASKAAKAAKVPAKKTTPAAGKFIGRRSRITPASLAGSKSTMPSKTLPKTLRLQPAYEQGLAILKRALNKPLNKMVNEAVGEYIERQSAYLEVELTTTLEELRAYRRADPEFAASRRAFIEGEALHGKEDPMEGQLLHVESPQEVRAASRFVSRTRAAAGNPVSELPAVAATKHR